MSNGVAVIIPTYNAEFYLPDLLRALKQQSLSHELIVIDSESEDTTQDILHDNNVRTVSIKKSTFNHGSTRNLGLTLTDADIVIYMTQDAIPYNNDTLLNIVTFLESSDSIAMAYGRQVPYPHTGILGQLARLANYPGESIIKSKEDIPLLGIKTCSCSNSFAAYKRKELINIGSFPDDIILGEDVTVGAKLILEGKSIAYVADSVVYHSHDYTLMEEFKRYFDIGVFHKDEHYLLKEFKAAESEGIKYVAYEIKYLVKNSHFLLLPSQLTRTLLKYLGYKLGYYYKYLPANLILNLSMHNRFWKSKKIP
ncbi:rhamnosyltransferase [Fibrella aestuarina BUZ 2]|uniref:Rhamnosyltransferase n=1 Tax=Fibrella aestuarina BUZ 2 TaxID=1166018 RepID=I0KFR4_9BACT|nr:glycosyltransferase family 2 protein [Fibrella aestuarina]CCH02967.1 rhamnosyltransferase [Fibrella aestuarina BUZ 2]